MEVFVVTYQSRYYSDDSIELDRVFLLEEDAQRYVLDENTSGLHYCEYRRMKVE